MRFVVVTLAFCFALGSIEAAPAQSLPANAAIVRVKAKKHKANVHKAPKRKQRNRVVHTR